jgi:hypothetical protein
MSVNCIGTAMDRYENFPHPLNSVKLINQISEMFIMKLSTGGITKVVALFPFCLSSNPNIHFVFFIHDAWIIYSNFLFLLEYININQYCTFLTVTIRESFSWRR